MHWVLVRRYFIQLRTDIIWEELLKLIKRVEDIFRYRPGKQKVFIYVEMYMIL